MNANELADSLYNIESILDLVPLRDDCATMLRQQQAEIEALKKQFDSMAKALNAFGVKELRYEK